MSYVSPEETARVLELSIHFAREGMTPTATCPTIATRHRWRVR